MAKKIGEDRSASERKTTDEMAPDGSSTRRDSSYFIESLARGLRVLAAFEPSRPELSQREIAEAAGVSTPSALRIGYTLVELGYLIRNPATKGYRLGPKAVTLGTATLSSMSLPDLVSPALEALRDETNENVKLAVLQGSDVVYIARLAPHGRYVTTIQVGSSLPAAVTSMGRAILSRLPVNEARRVIEATPLEQLTDKSHIDTDEVMSLIAEAGRRGYAINDQEVTLEHRSAAAPIVDPSGHPIAAVNISVSAHRVSREKLETDLVPLLLRSARTISGLVPMGFNNFAH